MKLIKRKKIYKSKVFEVIEEKLELENGKQIVRGTLLHAGAAVIVPQDRDGSLLLVRQYRRSVDRMLLEFPAGTLERGEKPLTCAKRELIEETEHSAKTWSYLGVIFPTPGFCDEIQHCYYAKNLKAKAGFLDEDEILKVERMSVKEVERAIIRGDMTDGKSIAIFAKARLRGFL